METRLKFSEAIRLGATMAPQAFGQPYYDGATCALAAACAAIGRDYWSMPELPWTKDLFNPLAKMCPVCSIEFLTGINHYHAVAHLNDFHLWTRERIADWVEVIELEQEMKESVGTNLEVEIESSQWQSVG